MKCPFAAVAGLPMSCSRAARMSCSEVSRERGRGIGRGHAVVEQVAAGDLGLRHAVLGVDLGQHHREHPCHVQDSQPIRRSGLGQHPPQLAADALRGQPLHVGTVDAHRIQGPGLDGQPQGRREPGAPQQAQGILLEPGVRITHGAQDAGVQVRQATGRIVQHRLSGSGRPCGTTPGEGVDGEVAPPEVVVHIVGPGDLVGPSVVAVGVVPAEGRDLDAGHIDRPEHAPRMTRRGTAPGCARVERPWPGRCRGLGDRAAHPGPRRRRHRPRGRAATAGSSTSSASDGIAAATVDDCGHARDATRSQPADRNR